jgi:hypothetical protein
MKTLGLKAIAVTALALGSSSNMHAQATVTFNYPWVASGIGYYTLYYDPGGLSFRVNDAYPGADMARVGAVLTGHPGNGTPHLEFKNTLGPSHYVVFACTNSLGRSFTNGAPFGLISVDLADPVAPSLAPIDITFNGFRADGSMVSQSFTVGGGGSSSFQRVYFGPAFAHGLVRVEIPSPAWAMDNLVWIPEPGSAALLGLGLLAWAARRFPRPDRS